MEMMPNKKIQFSLFQVIVIVIGSILISVGATLTINNVVQTTSITQSASVTNLPPKLLQGLSRSYALLKNIYMGDIEEDKLIDGALSGFVSGLGDQYTAYLNADEMKSLSETTEGSFEGIGVEIEKSGDYIRIVSPIDGSPAQKAGLQTDDMIVAVEGESTKELTVTELSKKVRGTKGSQVTITILRQQSTFDMTLTRDTIPVITVKGEMSAEYKHIGVIRLTSFAKTTYDEVVQTIKKLRQQGASAFVIDVRSNPGGLLDAVNDILNLFIYDNQVMFQMEDKENGKKDYMAKSDVPFKVSEPIAVLVNKGSASASEIFASAIQELNRGQLYGVTTFGKGTAQTILKLSDTTGVKITYSKWLTSKGNWIHEKGVVPNHVISLPEYATYALLNEQQLPKLSDSNDSVLNLQKILHVLGYSTQLTGVYDNQLEQVIKEYRKTNRLEEKTTLDAEVAQKINEQLRQKVLENDTQLKAALEALK